jgi:palmitoyltransferase
MPLSIVTSHLLFTNLAFLASFFSAMLAFFKAVAIDPGFIKNNISREQQRQAVEELANENKLDARHFCLTCLVRKTILCFVMKQELIDTVFRLENL